MISIFNVIGHSIQFISIDLLLQNCCRFVSKTLKTWQTIETEKKLFPPIPSILHPSIPSPLNCLLSMLASILTVSIPCVPAAHTFVLKPNTSFNFEMKVLWWVQIDFSDNLSASTSSASFASSMPVNHYIPDGIILPILSE